VNHGSLGRLTSIKNQTDFNSVRKEVELNVTSPLIATTLFLQHFEPMRVPSVIVNISSLAAVKPFVSWGVYCVGKAARDMLSQVVAQEVKEENGGHIKTLNYAPGPCDTNMQKEIRESSEHAPTREYFDDMHKKGQLVDPNDTARVLVALLESDSFESGSHVDYFDVKDKYNV